MNAESDSNQSNMTIAIPVADDHLAMHFGHCQEFAIIEVNLTANEIIGQRRLQPPPHEPGVLPKWLAELGADLIIAGGMGGRAQALFVQNNIQVLTGAPAETPDEIVAGYLAGNLATGENLCDH
jgi:predicted Fe-Mo cluster-binding NifX family protein